MKQSDVQRAFWDMALEFQNAAIATEHWQDWCGFCSEVATLFEDHEQDADGGWSGFLETFGLPATKSRNPFHKLVKFLATHRVQGHDYDYWFVPRDEPLKLPQISKMAGILDYWRDVLRYEDKAIHYPGTDGLHLGDYLLEKGMRYVYEQGVERRKKERIAKGQKVRQRQPSQKDVITELKDDIVSLENRLSAAHAANVRYQNIEDFIANKQLMVVPAGVKAGEQVGGILQVHIGRGQSEPIHFEVADGMTVQEAAMRFMDTMIRYMKMTDDEIAAEAAAERAEEDATTI